MARITRFIPRSTTRSSSQNPNCKAMSSCSMQIQIMNLQICLLSVILASFLKGMPFDAPILCTCSSLNISSSTLFTPPYPQLSRHYLHLSSFLSPSCYFRYVILHPLHQPLVPHSFYWPPQFSFFPHDFSNLTHPLQTQALKQRIRNLSPTPTDRILWIHIQKFSLIRSKTK